MVAFASPILLECRSQLQEPESKLGRESSAALGAIASASDPAITLVLETTVTFLFEQYSKKVDSGSRKLILQTLCLFSVAAEKLGRDFSEGVTLEGTFVFCATRSFFQGLQVHFLMTLLDDVKSPLAPYKDAIFGLFVESLGAADPSMRKTALQGLGSLIAQRNLLLDNEVTRSTKI